MPLADAPVMLNPKQFHNELTSRGYLFSFGTIQRWFRTNKIPHQRRVGGRYFVPREHVDTFIDADVFAAD